MSRPKPYSRDKGKRDTDSPWSHDLYDKQPQPQARSLATRLGKGSSQPPAKLSDRLSGKGKELLPDNGSSSKMFGFDDSKKASASRSSHRGIDGQQRLVANSLGALGAQAKSSMAIMGAAGVTVRVEHLARGTTAEDVKSAFAPIQVLSARLCSSPRDRTATVEVDVANRSTAHDLIAQYDGVLADGERLRLAIVDGRGNGGARSRRTREQSGKDSESLHSRIKTGKMYSDKIESPGSGSERSLAARLGRR